MANVRMCDICNSVFPVRIIEDNSRIVREVSVPVLEIINPDKDKAEQFTRYEVCQKCMTKVVKRIEKLKSESEMVN